MSQTVDRFATGPRHADDGDAPTVTMRRPVEGGRSFRRPAGPVSVAPRPMPGPAPRMPHAGYGPPVPGGVYGVPAPPPRTASRRGLGAVVGVLAAVVAVVATVGLVGRTSDVQGSVTVSGMSGYVATGQSCVPTSSVLRTVSLYTGSGELVGVVNLPSAGTAVSQGTSSYGYADACRYDFTLSDVRLAEEFYRVTVGSDATRGVAFTHDEIRRNGAHVTWSA